MDAKPYTVLTVRMPNDLQSVLEVISAGKGESVSTVVRDLVRAAAVNLEHEHFTESGRRGSTAGSPVSAKDFK
jgi:hypothetical protein